MLIKSLGWNSKTKTLENVDFSKIRYFFVKDYFAYVGVEDFDLDMVQVGVGKMFTFHKNVYVDPKVVYDVNAKTTNLTLGFGLKF